MPKSFEKFVSAWKELLDSGANEINEATLTFFLIKNFGTSKNNFTHYKELSLNLGFIEANKDKILRALDIFKRRQVNVAIFPEFCLTGYFWEDEKKCREYMDKGVIENHTDWIEKSLKPMLDDNLRSVILNNVRIGPKGKYYNSTFIVTKTHDYMKKEDIYNKVFLPGIGNTVCAINATTPNGRLLLYMKVFPGGL